MRNNNIWFLTFVIFVLSCDSGSRSDYTFPSEKLISFDSLVIAIDESTDYNALYPAFDKNTQSIWTLNALNNRLYIYDIDSSNSKFIEFDENLEFGKIVGYNLIGKDSIALINDKNQLVISNRDGTLLTNFPIKNPDILGLPLLFPNFMEGIVSPSETKLLNNYNIYNEAVLGVKISHLNYMISPLGTLPDEFVDGFYGYESYAFFSSFLQGEDFIVNFPNLNEIYVYDKDFNLKKRVEIHKIFNKEVTRLFPRNLTSMELKVRPSNSEIRRIENQYRDNFIFRFLVYNKWKNEYYRIIKYPISKNLQEINDPLKSFVPQYSIMVFDKDFNVKGEYGLEYNKYSIESGSIIPIPEGLAIQVKNNIDEDKMIYELFSFDNL